MLVRGSDAPHAATWSSPLLRQEAYTPVNSEGGHRYALLFRGEAYRWGCDVDGVATQIAAVRSHVTMVVEPLEARGHTVRAFFAHDHRVCKPSYIKSMNYRNVTGGRTATRAVYAHDAPEAIQALTSLFRDRVATRAKIANVKDQPDSIVGSLDLFLRRFKVKRKQMSVWVEHSSQSLPTDAPSTFDFLIVTR